MSPSNPNDAQSLPLPGTTVLPLANLSPAIDSASSTFIRAIVTLLWPYSSSSRSFSFILAEQDVRLCRSKGQVRVVLHGSSAKAVASSQLSIGDVVVLRLEGVSWKQRDEAVHTPWKGLDWDLEFEERINLEVYRDDSHFATIDIDHPPQSPLPKPPLPLPALPRPSHSNGETMAESGVMSDMWFSPAFLKHPRVSSGPFFNSSYDPFTDDDGYILGKGRKRAKLSQESDKRSYVERGSSPTDATPGAELHLDGADKGIRSPDGLAKEASSPPSAKFAMEDAQTQTTFEEPENTQAIHSDVEMETAPTTLNMDEETPQVRLEFHGAHKEGSLVTVKESTVATDATLDEDAASHHGVGSNQQELGRPQQQLLPSAQLGQDLNQRELKSDQQVLEPDMQEQPLAAAGQTPISRSTSAEYEARSQSAPTPRLYPLLSPELPLISPLFKRAGPPGSYFPFQAEGRSELDESGESSGLQYISRLPVEAEKSPAELEKLHDLSTEESLPHDGPGLVGVEEDNSEELRENNIDKTPDNKEPHLGDEGITPSKADLRDAEEGDEGETEDVILEQSPGSTQLGRGAEGGPTGKPEPIDIEEEESSGESDWSEEEEPARHDTKDEEDVELEQAEPGEEMIDVQSSSSSFEGFSTPGGQKLVGREDDKDMGDADSEGKEELEYSDESKFPEKPVHISDNKSVGSEADPNSLDQPESYESEDDMSDGDESEEEGLPTQEAQVTKIVEVIDLTDSEDEKQAAPPDLGARDQMQTVESDKEESDDGESGDEEFDDGESDEESNDEESEASRGLEMEGQGKPTDSDGEREYSPAPLASSSMADIGNMIAQREDMPTSPTFDYEDAYNGQEAPKDTRSPSPHANGAGEVSYPELPPNDQLSLQESLLLAIAHEAAVIADGPVIAPEAAQIPDEATDPHLSYQLMTPSATATESQLTVLLSRQSTAQAQDEEPLLPTPQDTQATKLPEPQSQSLDGAADIHEQPLRRSRRVARKLSTEVPKEMSSWFEPKQSSEMVATELKIEESKEESQEFVDDKEPAPHTKPRPHLATADADAGEVTGAKPRPEHIPGSALVVSSAQPHPPATPQGPVFVPKGLRTPHAYFPPLSLLASHFNTLVDILAVAATDAPAPARAKGGPKDYCTTLALTDPSSLSLSPPASSPDHLNEPKQYVTVAQLFRTNKFALPLVVRGDIVLLRAFKVQTNKHKFMLLSTLESAWVVFKDQNANSTDSSHAGIATRTRARRDSAAGGGEIMAGAPVEFGAAEREFVRGLRVWWGQEGEDKLKKTDGMVGGEGGEA